MWDVRALTSTRALMQLLSARRLLLMLAPSTLLRLLASVARCLSDPARSTSDCRHGNGVWRSTTSRSGVGEGGGVVPQEVVAEGILPAVRWQ